jgi:hypothetical protein
VYHDIDFIPSAQECVLFEQHQNCASSNMCARISVRDEGISSVYLGLCFSSLCCIKLDESIAQMQW